MNNLNIETEKQYVFLVTGGAGFIGSNLCEEILNLGHKVICLDNFSTGKRENISEFLNNNNFKLIEGDIRDFEVCLKASKGVDFILHEAAFGSVPKSIKMPLLYDEINIHGTINLMEAARENKVKKFIYASSSSVYGDSKVLPKVEGEEGNVLSPYALNKMVDEKYAKLYNKLYSLETIGLRYFNVYGKRQDKDSDYAAVIPKFVKLLLEGKAPVIYGDGTQSRDFTYVKNVVQANLKACFTKKYLGGEVFNIGCGSTITLNDLYYILSSYLAPNIKPLYAEPRKGDIKHSTASIDKAKELLDYNPEYNLKKGLDMTIEWYKENYA